jgi:hypothetical protein
MDEESKTEIDTVNDQDSRNGDSEVSSSSSEFDEQTNEAASPLMAAPTTGSEPVHQLPEYSHSILSANALILDDPEQDTDKKIDEEIKQNLEKQEACIAMLSMNDLMDGFNDESPSKYEENKFKPSMISVQPIEETQTFNEDELIDKNGEFIIFAEN